MFRAWCSSGQVLILPQIFHSPYKLGITITIFFSCHLLSLLSLFGLGELHITFMYRAMTPFGLLGTVALQINNKRTDIFLPEMFFKLIPELKMSL